MTRREQIARLIDWAAFAFLEHFIHDGTWAELVEDWDDIMGRVQSAFASADQIIALDATPGEDEVRAVAKPFLVFNIGCIECGVSSNVVGLYATKEEADLASKRLSRELFWREGGQNAFEVYDLRTPMHSEYAAALLNPTGGQ